MCTRHDVLLIADEIMTGFGRTGTLFACEQAGIAPDLLCLSKGITGGYLPLSCVLSTDAVFAAFYADDTARGFLHSHSYTGNALACRAALAVLDIFRDDDVLAANRARPRAGRRSPRRSPRTRRSAHFRQRGMIWAFEVDNGSRRFRALVLRRRPRARDPAAADRPHRLFHAALRRDRRRVRAAGRADERDPGCGVRGRSGALSAPTASAFAAGAAALAGRRGHRRSGAAASGRPDVCLRGRAARRGRRRRPGRDEKPAAFRPAARTTAQSRIGDEARHDVRRARTARPRLPLEDRCLPERPPRRWRSARRPDSQGPRRPQDHRRAMAGLHGGAPRERAGRDRRRPRSRPLALRLHRARPRRLRWRAAEALQRRTGRAARQFQDGQVRLRSERVRRRGRPQGRAAARERRCRSPASSRRRRVRRLARRRGRDVRRPRRARGRRVRRSLSRGLRRARVVGVPARPPGVRPRHVRHVLPRRGGTFRRRLEERDRTRRREGHSPRWSRRRCGTSSATSTSCRTT